MPDWLYLFMIFDENNYRFMYEALKEAELAFEEDEIPVGAVVVYKNRIIGRGRNQVEALNDPTAHAEILAITAACNHLRTKFLKECKLFVTVEPCIMCSGAIVNARVGELYFAVMEPKTGGCGTLYNIPEDVRLNHNPKVFSGIYENESKYLLKQFFEKKKKKLSI